MSHSRSRPWYQLIAITLTSMSLSLHMLSENTPFPQSTHLSSVKCQTTYAGRLTKCQALALEAPQIEEIVLQPLMLHLAIAHVCRDKPNTIHFIGKQCLGSRPILVIIKLKLMLGTPVELLQTRVQEPACITKYSACLLDDTR